MLSIIIPYHNEGQSFIEETIVQIKNTIDIIIYEIIIVDDCSDIPLQHISNTKIIRHDFNKGVGAAFDTGVNCAIYDNLFLIGSDIRFIKNNWASKILYEITSNHKSLICNTCVGLNSTNMDFETRRLTHTSNGATILVFHDKQSSRLKNESFRSIIDAKWLPKLKLEERDVDIFEIPCILGASYGVKKSWYKYIDGFNGHKLWGTLEPYISLKSWLFGGNCLLAPRIETGHIFKTHGTHNTPFHILIYNKLLVATLLFDDYERLINFLGNNNIVNDAKLLYTKNIDDILNLKKIYASKTVLPMKEFLKKFDIDYREFK